VKARHTFGAKLGPFHATRSEGPFYSPGINLGFLKTTGGLQPQRPASEGIERVSRMCDADDLRWLLCAGPSTFRHAGDAPPPSAADFGPAAFHNQLYFLAPSPSPSPKGGGDHWDLGRSVSGSPPCIEGGGFGVFVS